MKHSATKIFILALFFGLAMILGCGEGEKPPETAIQEKQEEAKEEIKEIREEAKEEVKEIQEEVKEETGDVVDSVTEFTIEQKEEYIAKVNEQMLVMEKNIQELKDDVQALEGDARENMGKQIDDLGAMYEKAANELSTIKDQGMDGWSEARQSLDNTMNQLDLVYQDVKSKLE